MYMGTYICLASLEISRAKALAKFPGFVLGSSSLEENENTINFLAFCATAI
jgi:hypothetical protein